MEYRERIELVVEDPPDNEEDIARQAETTQTTVRDGLMVAPRAGSPNKMSIEPIAI